VEVGLARAFDISQSGRFLRTHLYYGFNEDERGRKAFDDNEIGGLKMREISVPLANLHRAKSVR
jgi:hypothetical protein